MKKFRIIIFTLVSILFVAGVFSKKHVVACETVQYSNYEEIAAGIFVSTELKDKQQVLHNVLAGRNRVNSTFGDMEALPKIVFVANKEEADKFGANTTATIHYYPLGTCIVYGPKGQSVDVIAHELTHAEVVHKVGFINYLQEIPVWFNEGIALMVDYREPFLPGNIELSQEQIDAVKELEFGYEFFNGKNIHENYLASRMAVDKIDPSTLYEKLLLIRNGESFNNVFKL